MRVTYFPKASQRLWSNESVHVVINGSDSRFGVDAIGTLPASLTTLLAIEKTNPKIVISAGTCGGFTDRDGFIGEIILANRCVFHDRRIPLRVYGLWSWGFQRRRFERNR